MTDQQANTLAFVDKPQPRALATPPVPNGEIIDNAWRLAQFAAESGMAKTRNPHEAWFRIIFGWELGISPMTAIRTIYSVNGTPTCSGEAMLSLIRRSGLAKEIAISGDDEKAVVKMVRADSGERYEATFTIEHARRAGLLGKGPWQQYPGKMLKWRAVSECGKFLFPDVIGGLYTVEEMSPDTPVNDAGEPIGEIITGEATPSSKKSQKAIAVEDAPQAEVVTSDEPTALSKTQFTAILDKAKKFGFETEAQTLEVLQAAYPDQTIEAVRFWPGDDVEADAAIMAAFFTYDRKQIEQYTTATAKKSGNDDVWHDRYMSAMTICDRIDAAAAKQAPATPKSDNKVIAMPQPEPTASDATGDDSINDKAISALIEHANNLGVTETVAQIWLGIEDWAEVTSVKQAYQKLNTAGLENAPMFTFDTAQRVHKNYWHAVVNPGPHELQFRVYGRDLLREIVTKMPEGRMADDWQSLVDALDEIGGERVYTPAPVNIITWEKKPRYLIAESFSVADTPF